MKKNQKNYKKCDICGDTEATSLCPSCFCYYCDDCHKVVHINRKIKIIKKNQLIIMYLLILDVQTIIQFLLISSG